MGCNHANNGKIFRAVIVRTYVNGKTYTNTYGPYDTAAPAKGQITFAENQAADSHGQWRDPAYAYTATGCLQSATVDWEDVP